MNKFKVGDRVVRTGRRNGYHGVRIGAEGTVTYVSPKGSDIQLDWNNAKPSADRALWSAKYFELVKGDKLGRDVINVGDTVEFVENYGSLVKGDRVMVEELDPDDTDGRLDIIRYKVSDGRPGCCYKNRVKKVFPEMEEKVTKVEKKFSVGDRVVRTREPVVEWDLRVGDAGTVTSTRDLGSVISVKFDRGDHIAKGKTLESCNFDQVNDTPKYVTIDEAWQEGNVIEFTADAVRKAGDGWYIGCKPIYLSQGVGSGNIRSVHQNGMNRAEVRFRGVVPPLGQAYLINWGQRDVEVWKFQLNNVARDVEIIEKAPEKMIAVTMTLKDARAVLESIQHSSHLKDATGDLENAILDAT